MHQYQLTIPKPPATPSRPRNSRTGRLAGPCLGLILGVIAGCTGLDDMRGPSGQIEPEEAMSAVIGRVNANSAKMDFVLEGHGSVEARRIKADGKPEPFSGTVNLLFRRPRDLAMKLEHTLGKNVIQVGSNHDEFWVWKRVSQDIYWWGRHAELDPEAAAKLPLRPDQLVEIMGISDLPTKAEPQRGPLFEVKADYYELTFLTTDANGRLYPFKRVKIDRRPPYLVGSVVFLSASGRETAVAQLRAYRQVRGTAILVPHRVRIDWPGRDEFLDMDFHKMEPYDHDAGKVFTSPRALGRRVGEEIRVDLKPAANTAMQKSPGKTAKTAGQP